MRLKLLLQLLVAVAPFCGMVGCASPLGMGGAPGVDAVLRIVPAQETFSRDDEASLRLENRSGEGLGHGACALRVERLLASGWQPVDEGPEYCILLLYVVAPGEHADFRVDLSGLEPGTYRYRMDVMPGTSLPEVTVDSPVFRVVP